MIFVDFSFEKNMNHHKPSGHKKEYFSFTLEKDGFIHIIQMIIIKNLVIIVKLFIFI